jgi:hypothetical protein
MRGSEEAHDTFLEPALLSQRSGGMEISCWAYDRHPDLATLDAGRTVTIADLAGPGVVRTIHIAQCCAELVSKNPKEAAIAARGVVLEITFDDAGTPSVVVPLADFFADGCCGKASHFSTPYFEKAPESYNCFVPMPFARRAVLRLRNETPFDIATFGGVEWEALPSWDDRLGYFHATWRRFGFQLCCETDEQFFQVDGEGQFVGQAWSVATDEPAFSRVQAFDSVMEGNQEIRIDGEDEPSYDYLGTEDAFGFSWGFESPFIGLRSGINFIHHRNPSLLSVYRFRFDNPIPFSRRFELRTNWRYEFGREAQRYLPRRPGRGWVDYATTMLWYQRQPGFDHEPLPDLAARTATVMQENSSPVPVW